MKTSLRITIAATLVALVAVSVFAASSYLNSPNYYVVTAENKKPFHVGVTYCGTSAEEAQQLIDRVKGYTNLFVVQSGSLQDNTTELEKVCDYAVDSGLDVIVYFGSYYYQRNDTVDFARIAQARWGSHFLGIYFGDEPGGKMLDADTVELGNITKYMNIVSRRGIDNGTQSAITNFYKNGEIGVSNVSTSHIDGEYVSLGKYLQYFLNGTISYETSNQTYNVTAGTISQNTTVLKYFPDGSVQDQNGKPVTDKGNITQFTPYQQLWDTRPLQNYAQAEQAYVDTQRSLTDLLHNVSCSVFTSDFGLYWFDYKGGYDVVLAELGPSSNPAQDIALVRGAAKAQGKSWGTMITWMDPRTPSPPTGDELFNYLNQTYRGGGDYAVVFNYAPDVNGTGLLQDEHFSTLERFWSQVVQNPEKSNNVEMRGALVLPASYGWGMRHLNDTIWGIWTADENAPQVYNAVQNMLESRNGKIDIIYQDPAYPATSKYSQVFYWSSVG